MHRLPHPTPTRVLTIPTAWFICTVFVRLSGNNQALTLPLFSEGGVRGAFVGDVHMIVRAFLVLLCIQGK